MRNLKKVLTLVLTLAMLLSVMVVGAGAATFGDQESITNKEAVDVCTTLNIIGGYEDGTFRPAGNVTRAEMSKMICVALNGGKEPTLGSNSVNTFNDVTNDNWAKPYIEYCVSEGIVGGVGGGNFDPTGNITGTQAAKMLLCILGYDASIAGYVGNDSWEMKINVDASAKHLYDGITGIDASAALTRDQAAQMIWNALQANEVEYVNTLVTGPDGSLMSQATVRDKVVGSNNDYITLLRDKYNAYIDIGTLTTVKGNELAITLNDNDKIESDHWSDESEGSTLGFSKLTVDYSNLMGERVKVVTKDGKINDVLGVFSTEDNTVYNSVVNAVDIDKTARKVEINDGAYSLENTVAVYVNGTYAGSATLADFENGNFYIADGLTRNDKSPDFIKFVDSNDNNKIDTVLVSTVAFVKVTYVSSTDLIAGGTTYKVEDNNIAEGLASDDYVAVTWNLYDDCYDIVKAEKITSVSLSETKGNTSPYSDYKIDGAWYAAAVNADVNGVQPGSTIDAWVYNGVVAYAKRSTGENEALSDICVVIAHGKDVQGDQVRILKLNSNTTEVVKWDNQAGTGYATALTDGGVYEYSVRNDVYRFKQDLSGNTMTINPDFYGNYTAMSDKGTPTIGSGTSLAVNSVSSKVDNIGGIKVDDSAKIVLITNYKAAGSPAPAVDYKIVTGKQLKTLDVTASGSSDSNVTQYGGIAAFTSKVSGVTRVTYAVVAVNGIANSFVSNDHYGYIEASATKAADGYINYTIWTGTESLKVQEKNNDVTTRVRGTVVGYSSIDEVIEGTDIHPINDVSAPTVGTSAGELVADGIVYGVNNKEAPTKISVDGTALLDIPSSAKILYVNTKDFKGMPSESNMIREANKTEAGTYIPNVKYIIDASGDLEFLVVDVTNRLDGVALKPGSAAGVQEIINGGTDVTLDASSLTSSATATVPAGSTVTVTEANASYVLTLEPEAGAEVVVDTANNPENITVNTVAGSTVTISGSTTTIPTITGTGNVVIDKNIAGDINFGGITQIAGSANAGGTTAVGEGLKLSGDKQVTGFSTEYTIDQLAARTNSKTVTPYYFTLTGANAALESGAGTLTGKLTLKNGSVVDCVFSDGTSLPITSSHLDNNNLEMSATIGDNVQKVEYTITPATVANAKTWTFTF